MKRLFALLLALCLTAGAGALAQEGVLLVGEQHSVPAILDRELELWDALYHEQGARHLFVELPYYTAQLLNEWMAQEGDALLYTVFDALAGTAGGSARALQFYQRVKAQCPETVFHGTDVGHQYRELGGPYLARLREAGLEDSEEYALALACFEQGKHYYLTGDEAYRENAMAENFLSAYAGHEGEPVMGIYGSAHTGIGARSYTGETDSMATQLYAVLGDALRSEDLTPLAKRTEPYMAEEVVLGGKAYTAYYYGQESLSAYFPQYRRREFWRLEGAYDDMAGRKKTGDVLPEDNYPMAVEAGQVYMIDYLCSDGTLQRRLMRCDGDTWQGRLATWEIKAP